MKLFELKFKDIQAKQAPITRLFPSFNARKAKVKSNGGATLVSQAKGIFEFLVASGTVKNKHYAIRVAFLDIEPKIDEAAKDSTYWNNDKSHLNLLKVASYVMYNADLKLSSDDPSSKWWGFDTIRTKKDAELDNPNNIAPDKRNPSQLGIAGKHTSLVLDKLPLLISTLAEHLKKYFAPEIKQIEQDNIGKLYKTKQTYTTNPDIKKQGEGEKARRLKQIQKGTLKPTSPIEGI